MKDLHSILKAVARGKMEIPKAEALIQELFEASLAQSETQTPKKAHRDSESRRRSSTSSERAKSKVDFALSNLGDKIGFSSLLKKSKELGRKIEFKPSAEGFDSKLSIFSAVEVSADTRVDGNIVSGSQWKDAKFSDTAEVSSNHFTLSQVTGLSCLRSNFSFNEFGLTRLMGLTIQESRFEHNRVSRSQFNDVSVSEADFTHNRLLRTDFTGVVLNASRFANSVFSSTRWHECEFDQSDLQGLRFEDCSFIECKFINCEIVITEPKVISGLHVKGRVFDGLKSPEDLLLALELKAKPDHSTHRRHPKQSSDSVPDRKVRPRRH